MKHHIINHWWKKQCVRTGGCYRCVNESAVMCVCVRCLDSQLHQFSYDSLVFFDLVFKSRLSALIYAELGSLGAFICATWGHVVLSLRSPGRWWPDSASWQRCSISTCHCLLQHVIRIHHRWFPSPVNEISQIIDFIGTSGFMLSFSGFSLSRETWTVFAGSVHSDSILLCFTGFCLFGSPIPLKWTGSMFTLKTM